MGSLFARIMAAKTPLSKFKRGNGYSACIYPKPYKGGDDVVRWFYSRNNQCQVFFACSKAISDKIERDSWAEVSEHFTEWVEMELMPFCKENTEWEKCCRYGIGYDEQIPNTVPRGRGEEHFDIGCEGTTCACEPFGQGDFTYGIAEENEFTLEPQTAKEVENG